MAATAFTGPNAPNGGPSATALVWYNSTTILCRAPAQAVPGFYRFSLTANGWNFTNDKIYYLYYGAPKILSILPQSGSSAGGTIINITAQMKGPLSILQNLTAMQDMFSRFQCVFGGHMSTPMVLHSLAFAFLGSIVVFLDLI